MKKGNGKTARGRIPALTVAKGRLRGEQRVSGDLPGKPVEAPDLKRTQR